MTITNSYIAGDHVHLFTDTAVRDGKSAKVVGFGSKVLPLIPYNAVVASCGGAWINGFVAEAVSQSGASTFDELSAGFSELMSAYIAHSNQTPGRPTTWGSFETLLVGWSESKDAPEIRVLKGKESCRSISVSMYQTLPTGAVTFDPESPVQSGLAVMEAQRAQKLRPLDFSLDAVTSAAVKSNTRSSLATALR